MLYNPKWDKPEPSGFERRTFDPVSAGIWIGALVFVMCFWGFVAYPIFNWAMGDSIAHKLSQFEQHR
jgi:hypothetical protein